MYQFARSQYKYLPIAFTPDQCQGKKYIVTGSNIGLGYECVNHLVKLQAARVIMAVRNIKAGEEAKLAIEQGTGRKGVLEVWHLDLSSFDSVKAFAKRVKTDLDRVDGVVANAAVALDHWTEAEEMETSVTVNVVSTLLLVVLLLPILQEMGKRFNTHPRISLIGSGAAFHVEKVLLSIDRENILQDVNNRGKWESSMKESRYPLSKLLMHLAFYKLAELAPVSQTGIIINIVNPGLCYTDLTRNISFSVAFWIHVLRLLMGRSAEKGSRTLLHGIAAPQDSHGQYLSECEISDDIVPDWVKNEDGKLWQFQVWSEVSKKLEEIDKGSIQRLMALRTA